MWRVLLFLLGVLTCDISSLQDLELSANGGVIFPNDAFYYNATKLQNKIFDGKFHPLAVVYCATRNDVILAFAASKKTSCPLALRTGGHSFGGFSGGDGKLLLDFSRMRKISISDDVMSVEPGVLNEDVLAEVIPRNKFFGTGGCPTVAMGGYIQGGGWGNGMRTYGLAADSLISADIMLPNSTIITTNSSHHADLFWAIRGGGGSNWGIMLEYRLQIYPLPTSKAWSGNITFPISSITKVFSIYQAIIWDQSPVHRGMELNFGLTATEIQLTGNLLGDPEESKSIIDAFARIDGAKVHLKLMDWGDMLQYPTPDPWDDMPPFLWHSGLVLPPQSTDFPALLENMAKQFPAVSLALEPLGGKVSDVDQFSTAYFWRKALFQIVIFTQVPDLKDLDKLTKQAQTVYNNLARYTSGTYVNDMDVSLPNWEYAYYGQNRMDLRSLKKRYNPDGLFEFEQAIPVSTESHNHTVSVKQYLTDAEFSLLMLR